MDKEQFALVSELANKLAWKNPNLEVLRKDMMNEYSSLALTIQDHIKANHKRGKLILPDLKAFNNETVAIFSDYSGEGSGDYNTYSFLVCAWDIVGHFHSEMKKLRVENMLEEKEISFKDFRMGQLRRSIPDYLRLLDAFVPGFLFTLVVDKRLISLFGPNEKATLNFLTNTLQETGIGEWTPHTAEKLVRVIHVGAFLTGLLAETGQKIFWMSDDDAICANEEMHRRALDLFGRVLGLYTDPDCTFGTTGGAAPFKEPRHLETLDLLSVTDVVASSIEHYLSRRDASDTDDFEVKAGSDQVLQWLSHDGIALKKMNVIMRPMDDGRIQGGTLEFKLQNPPDDVAYIPVII